MLRTRGDIGWEELGTGPAVLVIHGATRMGKHYRQLAAELGSRFKWVLMDRRGRGASPNATGAGSLQTQVKDVCEVLDATGARRIFGHSAGGAIALEVAKHVPLDQLAVYEAPFVPLMPLDWVPDFERALARDDLPAAFVQMASGLQMGVPRWVPPWLLKLPVRALFRTPDGAEMAQLLRTAPADLQLAQQLDGSTLSSIRCPTLLISGSASPAYLREGVAELARRIPGAVTATLEGGTHNAPDLADPKGVAAILGRFFTAT